jgi:hypothetical protein
VLKSATSGKPLASLRPAVTAKLLAVNELLLVGRKLKRFFPTLGNFVAKVSMYNPDTDSYRLFYPADDHEEWLPLSEVVKKARIVARGFEQRKGVDYFQSFTAFQVSLRLVLALTASPGFLSVELDATSAFISHRAA